MTRLSLALLLLALIPASDASGRCIYRWYEVSGKVSDPTGRPVSALVTTSWSEGSEERSAQVRTLKNGSYQLRIAFSTHSGAGEVPGYDACNAVLQSLPLVIAAPGFEETKRKVVLRGVRGSSNVILRYKAGA